MPVRLKGAQLTRAKKLASLTRKLLSHWQTGCLGIARADLQSVASVVVQGSLREFRTCNLV